MDLLLLSILFFLIAVLYAAAGFGGGSSYLAVLSLFSISFITIRSTALVCNLIVVSSSLITSLQAGKISRKLFVKMAPFALASVPFAFLAGKYQLKEEAFFMLLGITLVLTSIIIFMGSPSQRKPKEKSSELRITKQLGIGGTLGALAGLVGIGGGIFLSPYLHLTSWDTARNISITSSFFILVNSGAGLVGQFFNQSFQLDSNVVIALAIAVFLGGTIGTRLNIRKLSNLKIRKVTAVVILIAGLNVLRKYLLS